MDDLERGQLRLRTEVAIYLEGGYFVFRDIFIALTPILGCIDPGNRVATAGVYTVFQLGERLADDPFAHFPRDCTFKKRRMATETIFADEAVCYETEDERLFGYSGEAVLQFIAEDQFKVYTLRFITVPAVRFETHTRQIGSGLSLCHCILWFGRHTDKFYY